MALRGQELAATADDVANQWQDTAGGGSVLWEDPEGVVVRHRRGAATSPAALWYRYPIVVGDTAYGVVRTTALCASARTLPPTPPSRCARLSC